MALSLWRVITLSLCGASAVRLQYRAAQPPLVRCSPPRCDAGPESAVAAEDEDEEDKSVKLVPMSTPLGFDELEPAPGPPVPTLQDGPSDGRAVFVSVGMFKAGMMPSEELTARYVQWLSGKRTDDNGQLVTVEPAPSVGLCRASYLNAQQVLPPPGPAPPLLRAITAGMPSCNATNALAPVMSRRCSTRSRTWASASPRRSSRLRT